MASCIVGRETRDEANEKRDSVNTASPFWTEQNPVVYYRLKMLNKTTNDDDVWAH